MIPKIVLEVEMILNFFSQSKKVSMINFKEFQNLKKINVFPIGKINNSGVIYIDIDGNKKKIKEGGYIHKL